MDNIIQTPWAFQLGSTADLALQIETGNFSEIDLALFQEALIANAVQDTDLFDAISLHNDTFINNHTHQAKIRKTIAALLRQSERRNYWGKALSRFGSAGLFVSREKALKKATFMPGRDLSIVGAHVAPSNSKAVSRPSFAGPRSKLEEFAEYVRASPSRPLCGLGPICAASDGAVTATTGWNRPEHLGNAWKLYKTMRYFWPSEDAPATDFHAFSARYGGDSGRQRYLEELGKLALQIYLDCLWNKTGHVEAKNEYRIFRGSLHGKPELDRFSWAFVVGKIPEWSKERIGFDVRETLDKYSSPTKVGKLKEPDLLSFRIFAVSLIALRFQKAQPDWDRHLAHLLGVVIVSYILPRITSLVQIPSEGIPDGNDYRSVFRIIIHHLDQIFPEFSRASDTDTESMTLPFTLLAKKAAFGEILPSDFEKLFEKYSPAELAAFLREVLAGEREKDLWDEASKLERQFIEGEWIKYKGTMEPVREITSRQLKRVRGPLGEEPSVEIDFGFLYFLDFLNQLNQKFHPFRLSREGWTETDRLYTKALSVRLAFAQEVLDLEKLLLVQKGQLEFIRSLFSQPDLGLNRQEQKMEHLKKALAQLEAKRNLVPEKSDEKQLIEGVIVQLQRLRSLIHELTGFWPVMH